jgi:hypothetical protein
MRALGRAREGRALLEGAIVDARSHGQNIAALRAGNNLASFTSDLDPRASLERTREGMALARRLGLRNFEGYHAGNAAGCAERLGEWKWLHDAIDEMVVDATDPSSADWLASCRDVPTAWTGEPDLARGERLLREAVAVGDWQTELNASGWLARCAFADGRMAEAADFIEPFLRVAESAGLQVGDMAMLARAALHAGQPERARKVLEIVGARPGGVADFDVAMLQAGLAAGDGRSSEALSKYRFALAGYREAGCRFDVALTILDMAAFLDVRDPAVSDLLPEAREILVELGATKLVDRLDGLRSARPAAAGGTSPGTSRTADLEEAGEHSM